MSEDVSEWRGLTDPERHETHEDGESAYCAECWDTHCSQELPCKCCGKAEVERLTAALAKAHRDWSAIAAQEIDARALAEAAQAAAGKRIAELTAEVADRDRRIAVALEPHVVREWPGTKICASCLVPWPCRYVKALRGES